MGDVTPINPNQPDEPHGTATLELPPEVAEAIARGMSNPPPNPGLPIMALGDCYLCTLADLQQPGQPIQAAILLVKGTGVCRDHVQHVANADLLRLLP